jgi:hypothetical protein
MFASSEGKNIPERSHGKQVVGTTLLHPDYFAGAAKSFGKMLEFCHHIFQSRALLIREFT